MKIINFIKNLKCRHKETKVITNLSDYYREIYGANSIVVCTKCGKVMKSNKIQDTKINNFIPKGDD